MSKKKFNVAMIGCGAIADFHLQGILEKEECELYAVCDSASDDRLERRAKKYGAIAKDGTLTLSDAPVGVDVVSTEDGLSINGKSCMFVLNNNISFDATGIDELKGENGTEGRSQHGLKSNWKTEIYDLSGRRVQKAQKGIFVRDGKKVMVR